MKTVSMVMLGVDSLERSVPFYRDVVGLELQHYAGGFAFFGAGGVSIGLSEPLGRSVQPPSGAMELVLPVESVTAQHENLKGREVRFVNEPREVTTGSWAATFADPDGHMLTLFGPR